MKTMELIFEESPWSFQPVRISAETLVVAWVDFNETELQRRVKHLGGKWNPARRVWEIGYDHALTLGIKDWIVEPKVSGIKYPQSF